MALGSTATDVYTKTHCAIGEKALHDRFRSTAAWCSTLLHDGKKKAAGVSAGGLICADQRSVLRRVIASWFIVRTTRLCTYREL